MTQDEFIAARRGEWNELDALLEAFQRRGLATRDAHDIARMAALYRALSADVARVEALRFSGELLTFLERLAARAHAMLYTAPPWRPRAVWDFLTRGFPATLRSQLRFFVVASLLFVVPMAVGMIGASASPTFAQRVLPAQALSQAAESYGEAFSHGRGGGEGAMMVGYYINNNIGIAFRCFATGIFFGLGSVFFLVFNGLLIGTTLGYVIQIGYGPNILSFVAGHSPFELTAIVVSGAAGLRMGYALVRTDGETRLGSLRRSGREILRLVMGAAAMLLVAAAIEGLWSGTQLPRIVKFAVGSVLAVLVAYYFARAGRTIEPTTRHV